MRFFVVAALAATALAVPAPLAQVNPTTAELVAVVPVVDADQAVVDAIPLASAVNSFLSAMFDPLGLFSISAEDATDSEDDSYDDFLSSTYSVIPRLTAMTENILAAPFKLGAGLLATVFRAQGRILRGLSNILNGEDSDSDQDDALEYGIAPLLPLPPLPKAVGVPKAGTPPKLVAPRPPRPALPKFPKIPYPPPKGYNGTVKGVPKAPKALPKLPKGLPKLPKGFPKYSNGTAKGQPKRPKSAPRLPKALPKLPKGSPKAAQMGALGSALQQQAATFAGIANGTVKTVPKLPKVAPKAGFAPLALLPPAPAA